MIEAISFYFRTMFDTKLSIDLKRYKQQSWISFVFLIVSGFILFYLLKDQPNIHNDAFYELSEKKQRALEVKDKLPFAFGTAIIFMIFRLLELPNEIHRANRINLNWKLHLSIMIVIFIIYFMIIAWQIYSNSPTYLQLTWGILILSNFCFMRNNDPTEEEKLLKEKLPKEEE